MKRMISVILLLLTVFLCCACDSHKGQVKIAGVWVDEENTNKIKQAIYNSQAEQNGDTYCKRCDRFIEGKVRICPYCGQYI